jgi:hypothetical protein
MNAEQRQLLGRWEAFLAKMASRLDETLAEAAEGLGQIVRAYPTDPLPLGNAINGVGHRVDELRDKIEKTWDDDVEDKFRELDENGFWDRGLDKKGDAIQELDEKWHALRVRVYGDLYRQAYGIAQQELATPAVCTHCGAELEKPQREPRSVACPYCRAVNQLFPGPATSMYFGGGPHVFAEEQALPLRFVVERSRIQADRWRRDRSWAQEPVESLRQWHDQELAYWTKYADVHAQVMGGPRDAELIESRMSQFRRWNLENQQQWVAAMRRLA